MILQRFNYDLLGVVISRNMDIGSLMSALSTMLATKPELSEVLSEVITPFDALKITFDLIQSNLEVIIGLKASLKVSKKTLETAVKVYNVGSTASMILLDTKAVASGFPLATGSQAALTPLKVAVENATTELQNLDSEINEKTEELTTLTNEYKKSFDSAVDALFTKLADIGQKNIII